MDNELRDISTNLKLQLGYAVGHILNDVCASMWFTYFLVYFHLVLKFDAAQAGILMLIGQSVDALATPFVGYSSDHTNNNLSSHYGKRKLWHLFGTALVLASFPFIFNDCVGCYNSHKWAQMYYYSGFITIFQIGWAAVQISHLSLIPELTESEATRNHLTALRYGFTVFSNIFVYVITLVVLRVTGDCDNKQIGPGDEWKFRDVMLVTICFGLIAVIIFHSSVKETSTHVDVQNRILSESTSHRDIFKEFSFYQVCGVYTSTRLFVNVSQVFIPLYIHRTLLLAARAIALVPLTLYGGALSGAAIARVLPKVSVGRPVFDYFPGTALALSAAAGLYLGHDHIYKEYLVYPVAFIIGLSGAWLLVVSLNLTSKLVGRRTEVSAFVYGLMSFTDKISTGIAIIIIQKYAEGASALYYRDVLVAVCVCASLFGLICAGLPTNLNSTRNTDSGIENEESPLLGS